MIEMIYIIFSAFFATLAAITLLIAITMPSKKAAKSLFGPNTTGSQIISGTIIEGDGGAACDDINNGFRVKVDSKGNVTFVQNGTISRHAMRRALEA